MFAGLKYTLHYLHQRHASPFDEVGLWQNTNRRATLLAPLVIDGLDA